VKSQKSLVVIAGPTAVGKTETALHLAEILGTEIISADSRQIYKEMTIGTAKPDSSELKRVKHHFIDTHSIEEDYDAAQFAEDALKIIRSIFQQRDYVIMCGGSGLYIRAVCEGFDDIPEVDPTIRRSLIENFEHHGIGWLQLQMQELDPELFAAIDNRNPHRLIRALEVRLGTGKSIAAFRNQKKYNHDFKIIKIGLELPRAVLYERIDLRMNTMIASGLFEEAKALYPFRNKNALQTVGYQEVFDYLEGLTTYEEAVELLKRNSRRYAKRQLTWFKKDKEFTWFAPMEVETIHNFVLEKHGVSL
jgi:tRNA dimethylallyltransferase